MSTSSSSLANAHVGIIGAGCAGLAAGASLARQGVKVTVLESAPQAGGRARSLNWKGARLDNGQHILLGAYEQTLALLSQAGVDEAQALMRLPLDLRLAEGFELQAADAWPAPLHLLLGLLRAKGLSWSERFSAIRFMTWLQLRRFKLARDISVLTLLHERKQTSTLIRCLWEPLCLGALNTPIDQASAQVFVNVLRDSFARDKHDSHLLLPRQDLSTLLIAPLIEDIQQHGGDVQLRTGVQKIEVEGDGYRLHTEDQNSALYTHVVLACQPFRATPLLADLPGTEALQQSLTSLQYQPIYTVYFQFDASVALDFPMLGLNAGISQWVFDRGQLDGQQGLIAVVISAEGAHQSLRQDALAEIVLAELRDHYPALRAPIHWYKVIAEKRATFSCTVGLVRPSHHTGLPKLYLAGDYVAGDYPATIEGAIRSGVQCAQHITLSLTSHTESHR
ncbi:squalene-associated FAD-dependent desaturase [Methylovorus glucosotrophus]|uniref:hydroxysqualene dehydroxylase HpnE n=1 Tax=Methylovorus glucosotrophus TaxID=266009 RepID=UPI0013315286|nr:hydroxysqualene dehydroxylase HpnE [Methylovorus glucosotrophus]KAF0843925.1 squalene-associated FAD-dependent desaturase [Methylovorus glucosotrophus]